MPFEGVQCAFPDVQPSFQRSSTPLEKSIFLHNICSIIDIEHPFQKCNMFETVSTIKECSFASYHWTTDFLAKNIPVKKQHSWKTGLLLFDMCTLPLGRSAQPSFRQLSLKEMISIQSNNKVFALSNISLISRGCCTNSTTNSSRTTILFQKSAACTQYTICSNNVWLS